VRGGQGRKLDASEIGAFPLFPLGQALQIDITKEERIDGGPIRQDVPSDWRPLVDRLHAALNRVGAELLARGFRSLADFLLSSAPHGHTRPPAAEAPPALSAALMVARLVACFPADFRDDAGGVALHRKAQTLVEDLAARFRLREPRLDISDADALTLGADAETAAFLRARGVLVLAPALAARVDAGRALRAGSPEEVALRAAAAAALVRIAEAVARERGEAVAAGAVWRFVALSVKEAHHRAVLREEKEQLDAAARISEASRPAPPRPAPPRAPLPPVRFFSGTRRPAHAA
jgi:hypothetical protein